MKGKTCARGFLGYMLLICKMVVGLVGLGLKPTKLQPNHHLVSWKNPKPSPNRLGSLTAKIGLFELGLDGLVGFVVFCTPLADNTQVGEFSTRHGSQQLARFVETQAKSNWTKSCSLRPFELYPGLLYCSVMFPHPLRVETKTCS